MAWDTLGNIYIAGTTNPPGKYKRRDFLLLKYNHSGQLLWVRTYGLENLPDEIYCIDLDDSQNIYVGGVSYVSNFPKIRILKYRPTGEMVWIREWTATGYEKIWGLCFEVLENGGIYLSMTAEHPVRREDWVIVKFSPQGQVQWERKYKETGNKFEEFSSFEPDRWGNIYLTGKVVNEGTETDFCTVKIDSLGNILWVSYYNSPDNKWDDASGISVDKGIYVAGRSRYPYYAGFHEAFCVVKYDSLGNELWSRRYGVYSDTNFEYHSMTTDEQGNIYVTGTASSDIEPLHISIVKYDSFGNLVWARKYAEVDRGYEGGIIEFDNRGNMYVIGITGVFGPNYNDDICVIKYRGR